MAFSDALRYPFRGEKKWLNILCATVCFIIPIIGPIVLMGYGVGAEKSAIADPDAEPPLFDFNRFTEYLKRGLPPFVVNLIAGLALSLLIFPLVFGVVFIAALLQKSPVAQIALLAFIILGELFIIGLFTVLITPLTLKAGLEQTIGGAFDWNFASSFFKFAGLLTLGYNLLLMLFSMIVGPFTLCLLIVGIYFFTGYLMLVQFHLRAQLYRAHIARHGVPLNIQTVVPTGFPISSNTPPTL